MINFIFLLCCVSLLCFSFIIQDVVLVISCQCILSPFWPSLNTDHLWLDHSRLMFRPIEKIPRTNSSQKNVSGSPCCRTSKSLFLAYLSMPEYSSTETDEMQIFNDWHVNPVMRSFLCLDRLGWTAKGGPLWQSIKFYKCQAPINK